MKLHLHFNITSIENVLINDMYFYVDNVILRTLARSRT